MSKTKIYLLLITAFLFLHELRISHNAVHQKCNELANTEKMRTGV